MFEQGALKIISTFIGDSALVQINISSASAKGLLAMVDQHPKEDMFDAALKEVLSMLEKDRYYRFQRKDDFKEYAAEHNL